MFADLYSHAYQEIRRLREGAGEAVQTPTRR